jgi:UPF0755 protein
MNKIFIPIFFIILIFLFICWIFFGPPGNSDKLEVFVVPQNPQWFDAVTTLKEKGFIKNMEAFQFLMNTFAKDKKIMPGGYRLSKNMFAWQIFIKITSKPDLLWVTITSCQRKEQIGEKLAKILGWDKEKLTEWNMLYTDSKTEYKEGVYYPDTYLIPVDESAQQVADRFINRFNEKFAPLVDKYIAANIKWTTGLKIASLIAREAAGQEDMKLISGIIWNRLDKGMPLQIDATMQYTLGKNSEGLWWGTIDIKEKQNDSSYNSYLHKGLPPTPICSPNIDYIEAVLYPEETTCLYYLHDSNKQIHCAETYEEHKENIKKYLE